MERNASLSEEAADVSPRGREDTASSRGQRRRPLRGPREDGFGKPLMREEDPAGVISLASRVMQEGHIRGQ